MISGVCFIKNGKRRSNSILRLGCIGCLLLMSSGLIADEIRFDSVQEWQKWQLPLGAIELTQDGRLLPVPIRKNINAVSNARAFGGGIRRAGSNPQDAALIIDGDPTSGWSPDPTDAQEDWFVEIDLGRGVSAHRVHLNFAEDGPPLARFDLLLSTGEPKRDAVNNAVEGSLIYRVQERYKGNDKHRVTLEIDPLVHTPFQFLRLESFLHIQGARLVEVEVETIGDNLSLGALARGGGVDIVVDVDRISDLQPLGNAQTLFDGSLITRWVFGRTLISSVDVRSRITLDLGAVYWADQVNLISQTGRPGRSFHFNNPYKVLTSDGSLASDGSLLWREQFSGQGTAKNRLQGLAEHSFVPTPIRYVRIAWLHWDINCGERGCATGGTTEELQVFGEGYPQEVIVRSPLIDLEKDKNLTVIQWQATAPAGTAVEIRSRTGNQVVEHYTFYDKNGKEITERRWNKLIDSFKGPIDTTWVPGSDWSAWSQLYDFSGAPFKSPSPRRFLELEVRLVSDRPDTAVSLDWLALQFSPPLARQVVGEIYPLEVVPGEETEFSYFLRTTEIQADGFDRVALEASVPLIFQAAYVDEVAVVADVETTAAGLRLTFPRPIRNRQLVELRFVSSVFVQATRFELFLEDSRQADHVRQRVEVGDASDQVASSSNVVRLPVGGRLLANLKLSSSVLTSNGDGIHDQVVLMFDLVNLLAPRPLRLRLFDLSGHLVWEDQRGGMAGPLEFVWQGRDTGGRQVPPGLYIAELRIEGDAQEESVRRLIAVAY